MVTKIKLSLIASSVAVALFTGCGYDNEGKNVVGKDTLIVTADTFKPVAKFPKVALQMGFDAEANKTGNDAQQVLIGINSYKINYMTTDDKGNRVKASGLITVPALTKEFMAGYKAKTGNDFSLSIVSDQHGTIFTNKESPTKSISPTTPNKLATVFSGVAGFMTIQPDYIGYGDSNLSHPYILEKSLANATVDMITAAISFANQAGLPINGQVFLSGYSEGGYATMAAAKEIQENHPDIHLMAVAPMAGPYDLETMGVETLKSPIMAFPPFLAYIVDAYAQTYDDVKIEEIVNQPYASMLDTLFDGDHNGSVIYYSLPNALDGNISKQATDMLFVPSYSDDLIANRDNKLRTHFRENSVIDWAPKMPMKLVQCTNDMIIPFAMNTLALNSFKERGSNSVEIVSIDTIPDDPLNPVAVHSQCAVEAYAKVIPWFDSIRKGEK